MDPFALALDAIFNAPGSLDAVFTPVDGASVPIRVIRSQPDQLQRFAGTQIFSQSDVFEIRGSDVANPVEGDMVQLGDLAFAISMPPIGDVEGLSWTCVTEPVT